MTTTRRRPPVRWLALTIAAADLASRAYAFGRLNYASNDLSHPQEGKVAEAGQRCYRMLGHGLGDAWMRCVVDDLLVQQAAALSEQRDDYFPVVNHTYSPFAAQREAHGQPGYTQHDLLKNLLRNATCDIADSGSQPIRSFEWDHRPLDPCASAAAADRAGAQDDSPFVHKAGFLPAGNDLNDLDGLMSEEAAKERCAKDARCQGFTYRKEGGMLGRFNMIFKSFADDVSMSPEWSTWRKRGGGSPIDCSLLARRARLVPRRLRVDVLREAPPVYIVHDFLTEQECSFMMNKTLPHMGPSVVGGGGTSSWRKSYSVNMQPDFDDEAHIFTQVARRKFAFAREAAGYAGLREGDGQEPVNAVYYKDEGDQYRPHCDGECSGGAYRPGTRLATGLSYCQMLFFGYMFNGATVGEAMDNGLTEHTGCPLRQGRKWIATMWYRENVTAEKNWEYFSRRGAFGV